MEILLFCLLIGACFTRPQREPARPWFWRRLWGFREEEDPEAPMEMESRLHVRQELDKKSKRMWTRISYRENGRSVSVKCQENLTLAFAGMVLKLEPSGVQVQDAPGEGVPSSARDQCLWKEDKTLAAEGYGEASGRRRCRCRRSRPIVLRSLTGPRPLPHLEG